MDYKTLTKRYKMIMNLGYILFFASTFGLIYWDINSNVLSRTIMFISIFLTIMYFIWIDKSAYCHKILSDERLYNQDLTDEEIRKKFYKIRNLNIASGIILMPVGIVALIYWQVNPNFNIKLVIVGTLIYGLWLTIFHSRCPRCHIPLSRNQAFRKDCRWCKQKF
ncbi:MAG: hypothetical protein ATN34_03855 [Epulopiscium sp. Nele67-Bin002]|nr:MAG: hypothetical protein ATN33_01025 [Epulopiscium sp. Nele67-Bin001]OON92608.1 MAG: hypothetical protein ATN34_03855 [Epulopiscium sp. Nele67-Bin002]